MAAIYTWNGPKDIHQDDEPIVADRRQSYLRRSGGNNRATGGGSEVVAGIYLDDYSLWDQPFAATWSTTPLLASLSIMAQGTL